MISDIEHYFSRSSGPSRLAILIDPDKQSPEKAGKMAIAAVNGGASAILVGGSTASDHNIVDSTVISIKESLELLTWSSTQDTSSIDITNPPVILFPSGSKAVSNHADAILFMSLLNSNDLQYVLKEQYFASLELEKTNVKRFPTAYLVTEPGGRVGEVGKANLILRNDIASVKRYASLSVGFGMRFLYIDAGSGASPSISLDLIRASRRDDQTLIVGGGIRTPELAFEISRCQPDWIVIGTVLEEEEKMSSLQKIVNDFVIAIELQ